MPGAGIAERAGVSMTAVQPFDLSDRDRSIVQLVARFKQLSSSQLHELLFPDAKSNTSANRSLHRLTEHNYLSRIERRLVGGARGGAGQYTYQLGRRGFYLYFEGRYNPWRTVNYHALNIVDSYIVLRRLERAGLLNIVGFSSEPDCWVKIGGSELKPDLYAELERGGIKRRDFYEIDMASEGQKQIRAKLETYYRAWGEAQTDVFPRVIWVAVDAEREKELRWLIGQMPQDDAAALFQVTTVAGLPALFGG